MLTINTYLADSTIQGKGLFTSKALSKGEPIWYLDNTKDMVIPQVEIPEDLRDYLDKYATVVPVSEQVHTLYGKKTFTYNTVNYHLDGDDCRYMNHSDHPNVGFFGNIGMILRDIQAHEELTCDYKLITTPEHFELLLCTQE